MQHAHGKALVLISPNQTKNAQKQALSQGSKQKHTYLMGFCLDPQMGRGVCQPAHGLGVPGVAGDARPRRPCASQPAHFAYSHPHYHKLASNINEVKCSVQHPTSLGVRQNSSFGGGVPPGRPDASARRPYQDARRILSHTQHHFRRQPARGHEGIAALHYSCWPVLENLIIEAAAEPKPASRQILSPEGSCIRFAIP